MQYTLINYLMYLFVNKIFVKPLDKLLAASKNYISF